MYSACACSYVGPAGREAPYSRRRRLGSEAVCSRDGRCQPHTGSVRRSTISLAMEFLLLRPRLRGKPPRERWLDRYLPCFVSAAIVPAGCCCLSTASTRALRCRAALLLRRVPAVPSCLALTAS